jgi:hypothetical protein
MFIRYVKEISSVDAERLKEAAGTLRILQQLKDTSLFTKDVENFIIKRDRNGIMSEKANVSIKLKSLFQPEYEITERFNQTIYIRTFGSRIKTQLFFSCGANLYGNISATIANFGKNPVDFYFGEFFPKPTGGNSFYLDYEGPRIVLSMAKFFHNRRETYDEIFEILKNNKKQFEVAAGRTFIKDLTTLFSVKEFIEVPELTIPSKNLEVQILGRKVKRKENVFLGTSIYHPKKSVRGEYYSTEVKNELWLNERDQLIINSVPRSQSQQDAIVKIKKVRDDLEFLEFINSGIKDWARAIITEASFGNSIYDKIKTRLLVENL